jgi:hypothetical protein
MTFADAIRLAAADDGTFQWDVPDGWQQGRGAWGGLVVGACVSAVEAAEPDPDRRIRTLTLQIVSPARVGEHRVTVTPLRIGTSMSTWSVLVSGAEGIVASGTVITGGPRAGRGHEAWGVMRPPAVPMPDRVQRLPVGPPFPVFTQHCDMRPVTGLPMSGGGAESIGWVGFAEATPPTAASLLGIVDAWWPASLPLLETLPPIATVSFSATLLIDPATVRPGEQLLCHALVAAAEAGFTSEHRSLWTADGRLAVDNVQVIVVS